MLCRFPITCFLLPGAVTATAITNSEIITAAIRAFIAPPLLISIRFPLLLAESFFKGGRLLLIARVRESHFLREWYAVFLHRFNNHSISQAQVFRCRPLVCSSIPINRRSIHFHH